MLGQGKMFDVLISHLDFNTIWKKEIYIYDIPSLYPNKWYGHMFSFRSAWMVTACSKHISLEKIG